MRCFALFFITTNCAVSNKTTATKCQIESLQHQSHCSTFISSGGQCCSCRGFHFQLIITKVYVNGSCCIYMTYWSFNKPPLPNNAQISYRNSSDQIKRTKVAFCSFSSSLPNNHSRKGKQKLPVFLEGKSSTDATLSKFSSLPNRMMNSGGPADLRLLSCPVLCFCCKRFAHFLPCSFLATQVYFTLLLTSLIKR